MIAVRAAAVDGDGVIALRPATLDDCELVWQWNFQPDVRAVSRTSRAVSLAEHTHWYIRRLIAGEPIWIVLAGGRPVGVVRLDPDAGGARISIALATAARGRGIGRRAVRAVCARWREPITAEVLATNTASRACFEACGFVAATPETDVVLYRWSP